MDVKQIRRINLQALVNKLAGGSNTEFAIKFKMDGAYLGSILNDPELKSSRNVGHKTARKIERAVGLEHGAMDSILSIAEDASTYNTEPGPAFKGQVPMISWVTAGEANMVIDLLAPGDAEEWLPAPPVTYSKSTYILKVKGDSMTSSFGKSYPDGCLIYVDPEQRGDPRNGDRVIAKINGHDTVTFKQLAEDGGRMFLKPLNPQYPAIFDEFRVLGKVIFKGEPE